MKVLALLSVAGLASAAHAQFGLVNDMYVFGDASDRIYAVNPNTGFVNGIANTGSANNHGVFGGPNNNFLAGTWNGIAEINGNTGAFIRSIDAGTAMYAPQFANNGNIYATGRSYGSVDGIYEYDYNTGAMVRQVAGGVGAWSALTLRQGRMYDVRDRTNWFDGTVIEERDEVTGALLNSWNLAGYSSIQCVRFDSFGNLYFASMYNSQNGIFRLNTGTGVATLFADNNVPGGGPTGWPGCHGFNFGPDGNLYCAMAGGTVAKYNGVTGAYVGIVFTTQDKLSDVWFKPVPAPGTLGAMALLGLAAGRRRRA